MTSCGSPVSENSATTTHTSWMAGELFAYMPPTMVSQFFTTTALALAICSTVANRTPLYSLAGGSSFASDAGILPAAANALYRAGERTP